MLKLIIWAFVCYGVATLGIVVLLFSFLRRCFIKDVKTAIHEAYDELNEVNKVNKYYNSEND